MHDDRRRDITDPALCHCLSHPLTPFPPPPAQLVRRSLAAGAVAALPGVCGEVPAYWAHSGGHIACVQLLAASRADPICTLACVPARDTPPPTNSFFHTIRCDEEAQAEVSLCDPDIAEMLAKTDARGRALLHHAVYSGRLGWTQALVVDHVSAVRAIDVDGWMPLHEACACGVSAVIEILLATKGTSPVSVADELYLRPEGSSPGMRVPASSGSHIGPVPASIVAMSLRHEERCGRLPIELLSPSAATIISPILIAAGSPSAQQRFWTTHAPRAMLFALIVTSAFMLLPLILLAALLRATNASSIAVAIVPLPKLAHGPSPRLLEIPAYGRIDSALSLSLAIILAYVLAAMALSNSRSATAVLLVVPSLLTQYEAVRMILRQPISEATIRDGDSAIQVGEAADERVSVALGHSASDSEYSTGASFERPASIALLWHSSSWRERGALFRARICTPLCTHLFLLGRSALECVCAVMVAVQLAALGMLIDPSALKPFPQMRAFMTWSIFLLDTSECPRLTGLVVATVTTLIALSVFTSLVLVQHSSVLRPWLPNAPLIWQRMRIVVESVAFVGLSVIPIPMTLAPLWLVLYLHPCGASRGPPTAPPAVLFLSPIFAVTLAALAPAFANPGSHAAAQRRETLPDLGVYAIARAVSVLCALVSVAIVTSDGVGVVDRSKRVAYGPALLCFALSQLGTGGYILLISIRQGNRARQRIPALAWGCAFSAAGWWNLALLVTNSAAENREAHFISCITVGWMILVGVLPFASVRFRAAAAALLASFAAFTSRITMCDTLLRTTPLRRIRRWAEARTPLSSLDAQLRRPKVAAVGAAQAETRVDGTLTGGKAESAALLAESPAQKIGRDRMLETVLRRVGARASLVSFGFPPATLTSLARGHAMHTRQSAQSAPSAERRAALLRSHEAALRLASVAAHSLSVACCSGNHQGRPPTSRSRQSSAVDLRCTGGALAPQPDTTNNAGDLEAVRAESRLLRCSAPEAAHIATYQKSLPLPPPGPLLPPAPPGPMPGPLPPQATDTSYAGTDCGDNTQSPCKNCAHRLDVVSTKSLALAPSMSPAAPDAVAAPETTGTHTHSRATSEGVQPSRSLLDGYQTQACAATASSVEGTVIDRALSDFFEEGGSPRAVESARQLQAPFTPQAVNVAEDRGHRGSAICPSDGLLALPCTPSAAPSACGTPGSTARGVVQLGSSVQLRARIPSFGRRAKGTPRK